MLIKSASSAFCLHIFSFFSFLCINRHQLLSELALKAERSWSKSKNVNISTACWNSAALLRIYSNIRAHKSVLVYFDSALLLFFFFRGVVWFFKLHHFVSATTRTAKLQPTLKGRLKEREEALREADVRCRLFNSLDSGVPGKSCYSTAEHEEPEASLGVD